MGTGKYMLNTSSGTSSSDSSIKESDSTRKKLKKLVNDVTMNEIVKNVCKAALRELKDAERNIERLEDKVDGLQTEKNTLTERVIAEAQKTQKEKDLKENLLLFARKYACPVKLRYSIEIFPYRYLPSVDEAYNRLSNLCNNFAKLADPKSRVNYLSQIVRQLIQATKKSVSEEKDAFERAWERLQKINYGIQKKTSGSEDLGTIITSLFVAPDMTSAEGIWCKQKAYWMSRSMELNDADIGCLNDLCLAEIDEVLAGQQAYDFTTDPREIEFLRDFFKNNDSLTATTKNYRLCFWILSTSNHEEIKDLLSKISHEWPNMNRGQRIHLYCQEFSHLYNIVSELDKHGPGMDPPGDCLPEDEDYEFYMHHLSLSAGNRIYFVAKTLYSKK